LDQHKGNQTDFIEDNGPLVVVPAGA